MADVRVTVNLPEKQVKFLKKTAKNEGLTFTDILRRSINSEKFFLKYERAGYKILVRVKSGTIYEVDRSIN